MEYNSNSSMCFIERPDFLIVKFFLLVILIPIIACFGLFGNALSVFILALPRMRCSSNSYLIAISCSDFLTLIVSMLLYSTETAIDYFNDVNLAEVWISYLKQIYVVSHCGPLMTVYFSVAATCERWFALTHPDTYVNFFTDRLRAVSFVGIIVVSVVISVGKYYEFDIITNDMCENLAKFRLNRSSLSETSVYFQAYTVWLGSLVSFIFPFIMLLIMNSIIACRIHSELEETHTPKANILKPYLVHFMEIRRRARRREATIVTLAVVFSFLICNSPSFLLTLIEYGNMEFLESHKVFYGFAKDTLTVLTTISCSINVILYVIHSRAFRKQLRLLMCKGDSDSQMSSVALPEESQQVLLLNKVPPKKEMSVKKVPKSQSAITPSMKSSVNDMKRQSLPGKHSQAELADVPDVTVAAESGRSNVSDIQCEVIPGSGNQKGGTVCKISVTVHIGDC